MVKTKAFADFHEIWYPKEIYTLSSYERDQIKTFSLATFLVSLFKFLYFVYNRMIFV